MTGSKSRTPCCAPLVIWTVGAVDIYDPLLAERGAWFAKAGRDGRGCGGTVFKTLERALSVARRASRAAGREFGVYEIELDLYTPIAWRSNDSGELLFDAPIRRRVDNLGDET